MLGFRFKPKVTGSTSIGITEPGKRAAERVMAGGSDFTILSSLSEHSPRTISEIAEDINMDIEEVRSKVRMMEKKGYIQVRRDNE